MIDLRIKIEAGKKTCAKEPGVFCGYLGSEKFGTTPVCSLFPSGETREVFTRLETVDGWLRRCPACLSAEKDAAP